MSWDSWDIKPTHEFDYFDPELNRFAEDFGFKIWRGHKEYHLRILDTTNNRFQFFPEKDERVRIFDFNKKDTYIVRLSSLYQFLEALL